MYIYIYLCICIFRYVCVYYMYMVPYPPNGLDPQVAPPLPFDLQATGSISEVQLRIC